MSLTFITFTIYSDKEIDLPFPAEHPYYSHIKCFSMIPNTSPKVETNSTIKQFSKDIAYPIFVKEKASDSWSRLENMHINSRIRHSTGPIWDLPRSHRHQVYLSINVRQCAQPYQLSTLFYGLDVVLSLVHAYDVGVM